MTWRNQTCATGTAETAYARAGLAFVPADHRLFRNHKVMFLAEQNRHCCLQSVSHVAVTGKDRIASRNTAQVLRTNDDVKRCYPPV